MALWLMHLYVCHKSKQAAQLEKGHQCGGIRSASFVSFAVAAFLGKADGTFFRVSSLLKITGCATDSNEHHHNFTVKEKLHFLSLLLFATTTTINSPFLFPSPSVEATPRVLVCTVLNTQEAGSQVETIQRTSEHEGNATGGLSWRWANL
jgi:hypothetical protein